MTEGELTAASQTQFVDRKWYHQQGGMAIFFYGSSV